MNATMIGSIFAALATATLTTPPPLPVVQVPPPSAFARSPVAELVSWSAAEIRCDNQVFQPLAQSAPRPTVSRVFGEGPQPVTIDFAIDSTGRTHAIKAYGGQFTQDLGPALAATRFAPASASHKCNVRYVPRRVSIQQAPLGLLINAAVQRDGDRLPKDGWERVNGSGSCWTSPRPQALLRAYPEYGKIIATPGQQDWILVGYDLDRAGRPVAIATIASTGNRALDAASLSAARGSRFAAGPRTGCAFPYRRAAATLAAPPIPESQQFKPTSATCPDKVSWRRAPALVYPEAYRSRAIEGWAIISFDLAPWGGVGNIQVLQSEPAELFGQQAKLAFQPASAEPSPTGATGCIERVKFQMSAETPSNDDPDIP